MDSQTFQKSAWDSKDSLSLLQTRTERKSLQMDYPEIEDCKKYFRTVAKKQLTEMARNHFRFGEVWGVYEDEGPCVCSPNGQIVITFYHSEEEGIYCGSPDELKYEPVFQAG
jgi:hypothetical protein